MFQQIISHTPLYVWAILAFLVYRGMLASQDREVTLRTMAILPIVMTALALMGIHGAFGLDGMPALFWLAGVAGGAVLAWNLVNAADIGADPARGVLALRGSWAPMLLMLSIFVMKYAVAVSMGVVPALAHDTAFAAGVCALYGLFSGVFIGRLLRNLMVYRQAQLAGVPVHAA